MITVFFPYLLSLKYLTYVAGALVLTACSGKWMEPALSVVYISPASGPYGTMLTITGQNFSQLYDPLEIRINGTIVSAYSLQANTLLVIVPAGATTGRITIYAGAGKTIRMTSEADFTVMP